ncbi:ubiquitin conjugation factor E4 B [Nematocida displodere]|uniref:Ubiquitin conjugation factor E4 B n=1 Tax=Nematocida displodere TaxID=1805483 RepID=A0A177EC09_9MICR|nr:ubiquitin conjugation factor E4 B [Nematocida displodere]
MIEDALRDGAILTDERFIRCLQKEETVSKAVKELLKVFRKIEEKKLFLSDEVTEMLVRYTALVVLEPSTFFAVEENKNFVFFLLAKENSGGLSFFTLLSTYGDDDSFDKILLITVYILGNITTTGITNMKNAVGHIQTIRALASIPGAVEVFRKRSVWGMPAQEFDGAEKHMRRHFNLLDHQTLPFFRAAMESFPKYNQKVCYDFVQKQPQEVKALKEVFKTSMNRIADEMYLLIKALILKDAEVKQRFTEYVFYTYEANKERRKATYNEASVVNDGYAINLSNVLAKFMLPVVHDRQKALDMPMSFVQRCSQVDFTSFDTISGHVEPNKPEQEIPEKFVTTLFYGKLLINLISYLPLGERLKEEGETLTRLKQHLGYLERRGSPKAAQAKLEVEIVSSRIHYLTSIWGNSEAVNNESEFSVFCIAFIQHIMKGDEFAQMPVVFIEGVLMLVLGSTQEEVYIENSRTKISDERVTIRYTTFCAKLLAHPKINVNYKQLAVQVILVYTHYLPWIPELALSLINFYIEVQTTIRQTHERMEERYRLTLIFSALLKTFQYSHQIKHLFLEELASPKEGHLDLKTSFLLHLISFLADSQERVFEELKKTARIEKILDTAPEDEKEELLTGLEQAIEIANLYTTVVSSTEPFVQTLLVQVPKVFLSSMVLPQFVSMLNSSLISLAGNKAKDLVVRSKDRCTFRAKNHLAARLQMYIALKYPIFAKAVVQDNGMFKPELFKKAVEICVMRRTLTQGETAQCTLFLQRVENVQVQEEQIDFPEEFIDPLTFAPMCNPVILKTSNTRVDRATATMILLNDPIDPFTREPLTATDIIDDPELKDRISAFIHQHKATQ